MIADRGYVVLGGNGVRLLAALDEEAARDLLRAALAAVPAGEEADVEWITAAQQWAVARVLDAGLALRPAGRCSCAATSGRSRPTSRAARTCSRYGFRTS